MRARRWLLVAGAFTAIALASSTGSLLARVFPGPPPPASLPRRLADAWISAALVPLVVRVCRAAPLRRGRLAGSLARHLAGGGLFAAAHEALFRPISVALTGGRTPAALLEDARAQSAVYLYISVGVYAGIAAVVYALDAAERASAAARDAASLEAELAEAELARVAASLRPQLFFAALERIVASIRTRPEEAEAQVVALADALRESSLRSGAGSAPAPPGTPR